MKLLFLLVSLFSLTASAVEWEKYLAYKKQNVSHERHLPYLLSHGYKTKHSVLLIHGTYASPLAFRGMADRFYNAGFNVVAITLPGHWEKNLKSMDTLRGGEWSKEADWGFKIALEMGEKVITSGHSLGGLLSIEQAFKHPDLVAAVVLVSPAVDLQKTVLLAAETGRVLGIPGNVFTFNKPDGIKVPYYGPWAGLLLQKEARRIMVQPLKVPLWVGYTWNDILVNVPTLSRFYAGVPEEKQRYVFRLPTRVDHYNISQSPEDRARYPEFNANPHFHAMMDDAFTFLKSIL